MLGEFDICSKRTFSTKVLKLCFVKTEYTKWIKDILEIEYFLKVSILLVLKPFKTIETWESLI